MSIHQRIRTAVACAAASVILVAAMATPAVANAPTGDLGERLEAARATLSGSIGALDASQIEALTNTLTDALESTHYGFQTSALRLLIAYGQDVNFDRRTVFDVVRLYRDHEDAQVRRMAVVALGQMDDDWAIDFLQRSLRYEQASPVKHTMAAVVAAHRADQG